MVPKFSTLAIIVLAVGWSPYKVERVKQEVECGLRNYPTDSSPDNLILLPPLNDDVGDMDHVVKAAYFGNPRWADLMDGTDFYYLTSVYQSNGDYIIATTSNTSLFTRLERRRTIRYFSRQYCRNGTETVYYFGIPLLDKQPASKLIPQFEKTEYVFNITADWDLRHEINTEVIEITEESFEMKEKMLNMTVDSVNNSPPLRIEQYILEPAQSANNKTYYRVDLYLTNELQLRPGEQLIYRLNAQDFYLNVGSADVIVNVGNPNFLE